MTISEEFRRSGQKLLDAIGSNLSQRLNEVLNSILSWPLKASAGSILDVQGQKSDVLGSVIYASYAGDSDESGGIPADRVGCVIDTIEALDVGTLRTAYSRVATAKGMKKSPPPNIEGVPHTTVTLGIIFAVNATVPLEVLAEEIDRLNQQTPSAQWPDMVVLLSQGVMSYSVQFPGESTISGGFLPPAEGALKNYIPAIYIVIVAQLTGEYAFNKMCAFLIPHLLFFSPGTKWPDTKEILENVPKTALTFSGFQYNLNGDLLPVPRDRYNDRLLPQMPLLIEDKGGTPLATIQYVPWQDGGVILLRGKLPLEGLLIFLGKDAITRGGPIKRGDLQISHVLPISPEMFPQFVQKIQQRTNMTVRTSPGKFMIQKLTDEGTSSPFIARLTLGLFVLRDAALQDKARIDIFDNDFEPIMSGMIGMRVEARKIADLLSNHAQKVSQVKTTGPTINIGEGIDLELKKQVGDFLLNSGRMIKTHVQKLANSLGINIGFLFQKEATFLNGAVALRASDPLLVDYLVEVRRWSEPLILNRDAVEHKSWLLPNVTYDHTSGTVEVKEPKVESQPVTQYLDFVMDRISCFVEEVIAYCLQKQMVDGVSFYEIPLAQRSAENPHRFRVTLVTASTSVWRLSYSPTRFEKK